MKKAADAFRSIGEVSQLIGVAPHVLRYWETQFPLFSPVKRRDGRRYYRPDDIRMAAGLCEILREEGVSIRGAKKQMAADRGAALKARGAARLGGDYAEKVETVPQITGNAPSLPPQEVRPATSRAKPEVQPAPEAPAIKPAAQPARRHRSAEDIETLPLFPELDMPAAPPGAAKAKPTARPKKSTKELDWLPRLSVINTELRTISALPRSEAEAMLARLTKARRILAA
ncbi:MAG: MerR family transcriptional regulator [Paracoccus sp. (in: a-proteobacteria)]